MSTETNGHQVKLIHAEPKDEAHFWYTNCLHCDWASEPYYGPDGEEEASHDGEGHETDGAYELPQMGGAVGYDTSDPLVTVLYLLLRDHVHPGDFENLIWNLEKDGKFPASLTNGFLAGYAANLAVRLRKLGAP